MDHDGRDRDADERIVTGPLVTPLPRRRIHQLARETVTLDRLSGGRLVLGVGVGSERTGEFDPARFGEEGDMKARAKLLDDGLEQLLAYWGGGFEPRRCDRIPIWVAARWPNKRPLRRAARHDGVFPIDLRALRRWRRCSRGVERAGRRRRHQPGRHGPGAVVRRRGDMVPDGLRSAAHPTRGRAGDRPAV